MPALFILNYFLAKLKNISKVMKNKCSHKLYSSGFNPPKIYKCEDPHCRLYSQDFMPNEIQKIGATRKNKIII